jgi:hypothetical protein
VESGDIIGSNWFTVAFTLGFKVCKDAKYALANADLFHDFLSLLANSQ